MQSKRKKLIFYKLSWKLFFSSARSFMERYAVAFLISIFIIISVWSVFTWYLFFKTDLINDAREDFVRAQYSNVIFDRQAFETFIQKRQARAEKFELPALYTGKDIFFPENYPLLEIKK